MGRLRPAAAWFALALLAAPGQPILAAPAPREHVVIIDKMKFGPLPASVRAGDTILWVNRDIFRHTATARDGRFAIDLPAGARGKILVKGGGTIAFFCKYHPGMTGRLAIAR